MFKKLSLLTLSAVSVFAMHSAELNINDKDLEFGARFDMGQFSDNTEPDTVFIGAKLLHADYSNSDYTNSSQMHDFVEMNFLMKRKVSDIGLSIGLGIKVNNTEKFTTVPLGVETAYKLPIKIAIPMYISGSLYYAPEALSMIDAKNFLEYRIQFDAEVIKNGRIIAGYRNIETNYVANRGPVAFGAYLGNIKYNKSPYVGFNFAF